MLDTNDKILKHLFKQNVIPENLLALKNMENLVKHSLNTQNFRIQVNMKTVVPFFKFLLNDEIIKDEIKDDIKKLLEKNRYKVFQTVFPLKIKSRLLCYLKSSTLY